MTCSNSVYTVSVVRVLYDGCVVSMAMFTKMVQCEYYSTVLPAETSSMY